MAKRVFLGVKSRFREPSRKEGQCATFYELSFQLLTLVKQILSNFEMESIHVPLPTWASYFALLLLKSIFLICESRVKGTSLFSVSLLPCLLIC